MIVLSVDPGTTWTAAVLLDLDAEEILGRWYLPNPMMNLVVHCVSRGISPGPSDIINISDDKRSPVFDDRIRKDMGLDQAANLPKPEYLVVEMVGNYSQTVGRSTFETCMWSGRFIQAAGIPYTLITRTQSRTNITGTSKCGDAQVNRALLDRIGEKGTKKKPGPMYGMKSDLFAALAVGLTFKDLEAEYQAIMSYPERKKLVDAGKFKLKPFCVQLEADGGDQTLTWPVKKS